MNQINKRVEKIDDEIKKLQIEKGNCKKQISELKKVEKNIEKAYEILTEKTNLEQEEKNIIQSTINTN